MSKVVFDLFGFGASIVDNCALISSRDLEDLWRNYHIEKGGRVLIKSKKIFNLTKKNILKKAFVNRRQVGGHIVNVSKAAASSGMNCKIITAIGVDKDNRPDENGILIKQGLEKNKINFFLEKIKGYSSEAITVSSKESSERTMLVYSGTKDKLSKFEVESCKVFIVSLYQLAYFKFRYKLISILKELKEKRTKIALNLSHRNLVRENPDLLKKVILEDKLVDLLFSNEEEYNGFCNIFGGRVVVPIQVTTKGIKGSRVRAHDVEHHIHSSPIKVVPNNTGAGDYFEGFFISTYLNNNSLMDSLKFASIQTTKILENNNR